MVLRSFNLAPFTVVPTFYVIGVETGTTYRLIVHIHNHQTQDYASSAPLPFHLWERALFRVRDWKVCDKHHECHIGWAIGTYLGMAPG